MLETDDDRVVCHICGESFKLLANHVWRTHDVTPQEYRAYFGLRMQRGLLAPPARERRRAIAETTLLPYFREHRDEIVAKGIGSLTPEQRAANAALRPRPLETRLDPATQQRLQAARERALETRRIRIRSGELKVTGGFASDPALRERATTRAQARRKELLQDPEYRRSLSERIIQSKAAREVTSCIVCGASYEVVRSWLRAGYGKTCSAACRTAWKLNRGRQRRGRPWEEVAAQLNSLPSGRLDELPAPVPEVLRLFYGLVDGTPWTQRAIAERLNVRHSRVGSILHGKRVAALLGEPPHRHERRLVTVNCAICGAAVERSATELKDRTATMCSQECRLEFRRRAVAVRWNGDPAVRARAVAHIREHAATAEFRNAVRERALRRARPYAEALRALSEDAFGNLPDDQRMVVRAYYGLDGEITTLDQLARRLHAGQLRVRGLLNAGLVALLGQPVEFERPNVAEVG